MPEVSDVKSNYLNQQDRSVNIQKTLEEQKKVKEGGLADVEIVEKAKSMGKDDFLKLLITQLTHQDPTQPVKDQAFIAQMAQFSSLEQMNNIATSMNQMSDRQSANLVGRFVVGKDFVSGDEVTGIAGALFFDQAGQSFLKVSGRTVRVKDITLVGDPKFFKKEFGGLADDQPAQSNPAVNAASNQNQAQRASQEAINPVKSRQKMTESVQEKSENPTPENESTKTKKKDTELPPGYQETSHSLEQKSKLSLSA